MNHLDPETNQYINFNLIGTFLYYIRILQVIFNPSYAIFPNKLGQYHQNRKKLINFIHSFQNHSCFQTNLKPEKI